MRGSFPPWLVAASFCLAALLPGQSWTSPQAAIRRASRALPGPSVWTSLFDGGSVPFVPEYSTAYDASRDRIVLLEPACGIPGNQQTWEFDGSRWRQVLPGVSPPPRNSTSMVYDAHRKRIVIFGGLGAAGDDDMWEWDGTTWTELAPVVRPSGRAGHMMAYDEMRRCVVLFGGGSRGGTAFDDTWTWDGTTWQEQMPATRPSPRGGAGIAYDSVRGRIVMFGGIDRNGFELAETWEWDGTDWAQFTTGERPWPRSSPGLAYDPQRRQTILFGGFGGSFGFGFEDTWGFDGQRWMPLDAPGAGPLGRAAPGMVYDSKRGRIVMYGGSTFPFPGRNCFADVWTLDSPTPGVAGFGAGCPGAAGVPVMSLDLQASGTLGLRLSPLSTSPGASAFFAFGASRQQWGGLSLPAPLASLGFPLCSLWVGLDVIVPALPQAGVAEFALRVPGSVVLHAQGLALDAGGLSLSGAATVDTAPR